MSSGLICNIPVCANRLGENTIVSSCGHCFCKEHGEEWFSRHNICPICSNETKVISMNFSKSYISRSKSLLLVGFSPQEIMEAVSSALEFWNNQKQFEIEKMRTSLMNSKEESYNALQEAYSCLKTEYEDVCCELRRIKEKNESLESPILFDPPTNLGVAIKNNSYTPYTRGYFTPLKNS